MQNNKGIWAIICTCVIAGLLSFNIFYLGSIKGDIGKLDDKIFIHLTNADIHVPRGYVVSKAEFSMHRNFAEMYKTDVITRIDKLEEELRKVFFIK